MTSYVILSSLFLKKFGYLFLLPIFLLTTNSIISAEILSIKRETIESEKILSKEKIDTPYILDTNDILEIMFKGINIFSGKYSINEDGYIYLPEINDFFVRGLTLKELEKILIKEYKEFIFNPELKIVLAKPRQITIYLGGEVNSTGIFNFNSDIEEDIEIPAISPKIFNLRGLDTNSSKLNSINQAILYPRVFDALKKGDGIKKNADLSRIIVKRRMPRSSGVGEVFTELNILSLMLEGEQSQNIILRDGDSIIVPKSEKNLHEQFLAIARTNINPNTIRVYVNGNVPLPGLINLPRNSFMYDAVAAVGGTKNNSGLIELIRFDLNGNKKTFNLGSSYPKDKNNKNNPKLISGDLIFVRKNILGKTSSIITEIGSPLINAYGIYSLFD